MSRHTHTHTPMYAYIKNQSICIHIELDRLHIYPIVPIADCPNC